MHDQFLRTKLASRLKIIWQPILIPKRHNKHIIAKAEKYLFEVHNVTPHIRGWVGSFEFVTSVTGSGWQWCFLRILTRVL